MCYKYLFWKTRKRKKKLLLFPDWFDFCHYKIIPLTEDAFQNQPALWQISYNWSNYSCRYQQVIPRGLYFILLKLFSKRNSNLFDEHGEQFLQYQSNLFGPSDWYFQQISKHNINYSLRYLKEEYLHNCTVKIDEAFRMYHRNIFQLSAKTKDDHNKKKIILKSNYNLNFLISIAHLFL